MTRIGGIYRWTIPPALMESIGHVYYDAELALALDADFEISQSLARALS